MERMELIKNVCAIILDCAKECSKDIGRLGDITNNTRFYIENCAKSIIDGAEKNAKENQETIIVDRKFIIENATKLNIPFEEAVKKIESYYKSGLVE